MPRFVMPFEQPGQAAVRRAAKAQRAKELAEKKKARDLLVQERLLVTLSAQYVRGYEELGALLRVSERQAFSIASRPDFPKPRSISEGVRLWKTESVITWIDEQPGDKQ